MTPYDLETVIYYIRDNKVHSAPILSRWIVDNAHPDWNATPEQRNTFQSFGKDRCVYATCHGTVSHEEAFPSVQDLINSLTKDVS